MKLLKHLAPLFLLCALAAPAAAAQDTLTCYVSGQIKPCPDDAKLKSGKTLALANIPAMDIGHIVAALVSGGNPITGTILVASTRTETPTIGTAAGAQHALPAGTAALLAADSSLPAANLTGDVAQARIAVALAVGGIPITATVLVATTRTETPTIGTSSATQHALPSGTAALLAADSSLPAENLTGDVARARLTTGLAAGGDPVSGTVVTAATRVDSPSVGTASGTQHALPTGTGAVVTTDATQNQTNKTLTAPVLGGTVTGTYTLGGTPTLGANLAAGSNKITGLTSGTASGEALAYPWITGTAAASTLASSPYNLTTTDTYEVIGAAASIPSAGTYWVVAKVRALVNCTVGAGFMVSQLYNTTTTTAIAESETFGPYCSTIMTNYYATVTISAFVVTVGAATINVRSLVPSGVTYAARQIVSDANGTTRIFYIKLAP